ncbi:MAG: hypothetical protein F6K30_15505 [Cyanothece sp. SIO2G6]|nr:hypothetical protein [Cyanothece sp. SIO2G6]
MPKSIAFFSAFAKLRDYVAWFTNYQSMLAIAPKQPFKVALMLMVRQVILLPEWRCAIAAIAIASTKPGI